MHNTRRLLLTGLLIATPCIVALAATIWFFHAPFQPEERSSVGTLVLPQVLIPTQLRHPERKWQVMTVIRGRCDRHCKERIWVMRNAYWALGKQVRRASDSVLIVGDDTTADLQKDFAGLRLYNISQQELDRLLGDNAQLPDPDHLEVWLVDPLGYIVLRYGTDNTGNHVLRDWRRLLRISQIG